MSLNRKFIGRYAMVAGLLTLSAGSMLRNNLSDFQWGFCEGMSLVLIAIGFVKMIQCFLKKENPFRQ